MPAISITEEQIRAKAIEQGLIGADATEIPDKVRARARHLVARDQIAAAKPAPQPQQVDGRHLARNTRAMYLALVDEGFSDAQALAICGHAMSRHVN